MKHWQLALIGSTLGCIIVYFLMPHIDKITQKIVIQLINTIKPVRVNFFVNLRKRNIFKPNLFLVEVFVFIIIFVAIFAFMNLKEINIQVNSMQEEYISNDTTGVLLKKSVLSMSERVSQNAVKYLSINIFILILFIYIRSEALISTKMVNTFKDKKITLLKTPIKERDFIVFDFKWGSINSFEDYNKLCAEMDNYIFKLPTSEIKDI